MLASSSPCDSAALGWMKSPNSTSFTFRPFFSATFLATSAIWACGPEVTPMVTEPSAAWAGSAAIPARGRTAVRASD